MPGETASTYPSQTVYPLTFLHPHSPTLSRQSYGLMGDPWASLSPPSSRKDSGGATSSSNASSDSSPPSPGSSKGVVERESGSFVDVVPFPYPPRRNVFIEPGSGMRDVPMWLKTLRLHKYTSLFQQISYDEMLALNERQLEQQGVTKGARHKIVVCVGKLGERSGLLRGLEKEAGEPATLRPTLQELKAVICTPIRPFPPPGRPEPYQSRIDGIDIPAEELDDENLPAHFTRVLGKLATGVFAALGSGALPDGGDDLFPTLLHVLDRCLNHEAFTQAQKRRVLNWKQVVKRVWQPIRRPSAGNFGYRAPWPGKNRPGPPPPRPRWTPPHARLFPSQPPTPDPYSIKQNQAMTANWQLQAMLGYLSHNLPPLCSENTYSYDKNAQGAAAPSLRSVQEMASALAAYGGMLNMGNNGTGNNGGCNGGCARPPQPDTSVSRPPTDWGQAPGAWSPPAAFRCPPTTAANPAPAPPPPPKSEGEWGGRAGSPKAFHFSPAWSSASSDSSSLSSRMEHLCRSVAEVALVEQISAAAKPRY